MMITLMLDDDVEAALEHLRLCRNANLNELVNEALRRGLREISGQPRARERFQTRAVSLGKARFTAIDDVAETVAVAEGEGHK